MFVLPIRSQLPSGGWESNTYEVVRRTSTRKMGSDGGSHPSSPQYVHHAVVYIGAGFRMVARAGRRAFTARISTTGGPTGSAWTTSDLLLVYAPAVTGRWPDGMAKFVPAGSDLVFSNPLHHEWRSGEKINPASTCVQQSPRSTASLLSS